MDAQRVRNLTTGLLHTKMEDIYEDIEYLVGEEGIMTHHLPAARNALLPFLKYRVGYDGFWNEKYDPTHTGEINLVPLTADEQEQFWPKFEAELEKMFNPG